VQPNCCRPDTNAAMRACASTSSAVMAISTPMRRTFSDCCATAASGQVAVEPAITFMKSRRLIASPEAQDKASCGINVAHWKGSRRGQPMSALGQKQTYAAHQPLSALPLKADMCGATRDGRFGPIADIAASFNHVVGNRDHARWNGEVERLSGFEINHKFVRARLHNR